jgi:hypothetical protein
MTAVQPGGYGMGQHAQHVTGDAPGGRERRFPTFRGAAASCAASRIWVGEHPPAGDRVKTLGDLIVHRTLTAPAAVPFSGVRALWRRDEVLAANPFLQ